MNSLFIIIPAYNEEFGIYNVVNELTCFDNTTVLVVDDHSTDNTLEILNNNSINYIQNQFKPGRDGCIKSGILYCQEIGLRDWVIIFDGDGQHSSCFIDHVRTQEPGNVIFKGNRFSSDSIQLNTPIDRVKMANALFNYVNKSLNILIQDINCGLLAIPKGLLNWVIDNCSFDKHFSVEIIIRSKLDKSISYELTELPVPAIYNSKAPKHIHLYNMLSAETRFETRYRSIIEKIDEMILSLTENHEITI